jgi:hypothetical protein
VTGGERLSLRALVISAAVISAAAFAACAFQDRAERMALVYGVSLYVGGVEDDGASGPNLQFCDDDADSMASLFERNGYTVLRRISGDTNPTAEAPSETQILADLAALPPGLDRLVVYFSGHGDWDESANEQYICPYGSVSLVDGWYQWHVDAFMSTDELRGALALADVPQTVLILDTCFSGGFVTEGGGIDMLPPSYDPGDAYGGAFQASPFSYELAPPLLFRFMAAVGENPGTIVLSAAGAEEFSWEDSAEGHGIFTMALLGSPSGGADSSGDSSVSASEAYAYAARFVNRYWNEAMGSSYYDFMPRLSPGSLDYALFAAE